MAISSYLQSYLQDFQRAYTYRHQATVDCFEVDDLALSVGKFYEKIRKVIDWKDENALRRGALVRGLKRNLISQLYALDASNSTRLHQIAETMVMELMRSGYFDNKLMNMDKVDQVSQILQKYVLILKELNVQPKTKEKKSRREKKDLKQQIKLQSWLVQIAACELEEYLAPSFETKALVNLMTNVLTQRIRVIPKDQLSEPQKQRYLAIAVWRSLFSADVFLVGYELLKTYHPQFIVYGIDGMANPSQILQTKDVIDAEINSPVERKYARIANKYDAAYRILGDMTKKEQATTITQLTEFYQDEEKVKASFKAIYAKRYKSLKKRLLKLAFWTTLSILVGNAASVIIIEWPVAMLLGYDFGAFAIAMDIMIPTIVMFALVMLIRPPRKENEAIVWQEIDKIINDQREQDVYEIRLGRKPNKILQGFFTIMTIVAGLAAFWAIASIFFAVGMPPTSVYVNLVYITMVFFASLGIRSKAQEITVYEKSTLLDFVLDIFSIPLARIGQWFAKKWKEYNIFSIVFSVMIDAPLSMFIGFIEEWSNFLKEKKAEMS